MTDETLARTSKQMVPSPYDGQWCHENYSEAATLINRSLREIESLRAENDKLLTDFLRYRQALYRANGFLIMRGFEPVKLEYSDRPASETEKHDG